MSYIANYLKDSSTLIVSEISHGSKQKDTFSSKND